MLSNQPSCFFTSCSSQNAIWDSLTMLLNHLLINVILCSNKKASMVSLPKGVQEDVTHWTITSDIQTCFAKATPTFFSNSQMALAVRWLTWSVSGLALLIYDSSRHGITSKHKTICQVSHWVMHVQETQQWLLVVHILALATYGSLPDLVARNVLNTDDSLTSSHQIKSRLAHTVCITRADIIMDALTLS